MARPARQGLSDDESGEFHMFGLEVGGLFGLIWLIIILWAIIKVAQSNAGALAKAIWIVVLLFLPLIGLIAWLLFGPKG
jgi:hypothetical protein